MQDTLVHLNFEKANGKTIYNRKTGKAIAVSTVRKQAELVPGAVGKGLRTDGYSTFVAVDIATEKKGLSAMGWFALETYPTDTAGFLLLQNKAGTEWIAAGINQFGYPVLEISENGSTHFFTATTTVERFKWLHIALVTAGDSVKYYINGKLMLSQAAENRNTYRQLVVGRNGKQRHILQFPLNYFNGIADEVILLNKAYQQKDIAAINYTLVEKRKPNLSVPFVRFKDDFHRPKYHLIPAANWTNETHGLIYYQGRYHIFNQKDGNNLLLRNINWGHFSSKDMLQWTEHKPVLSPGPDYDRLGIWSGHCVLDPLGKPVIIYTGASSDTSFGMHLAYPEADDLLSWKKYAGNPVVNGTPKQYTRFDFRDPYIWKEGSSYYMAVGFGIDENNTRRGALLLYRSTDLKEWMFLHTLFEGKPSIDDSGVFWEMPVFWKENNKYILLVNKVPYKKEPANALYWIGDFVNEKFVPDKAVPQKLEVINQLLSPSVAKDESGLTTAIAIIPDLVTAEAHYKQGWAHLYSIPRVWTLKNNKLCQQPHPSLKKLRTDVTTLTNVDVLPGKPILLSKNKQQLEIELELDPKDSKRFGVVIGKHPHDKEYTKIYFDFDQQEFVVDKSRSSLDKNIPNEGRSGTYNLSRNQKVKIRLFIDGSVVECFINNEDAFTTRIFPLKSISNEVHLYCEGGEVKLSNATVWKLRSSNNQTEF
ncbi:GH32 C-terminal domain-containing protein [Lacibacter sp. H375]|uniref:GH32 C-terminal domain-containing protein n=1 Tax=Lacibacter sp. H375 TaxID=3133424 RepID=UPI0030C13948